MDISLAQWGRLHGLALDAEVALTKFLDTLEEISNSVEEHDPYTEVRDEIETAIRAVGLFKLQTIDIGIGESDPCYAEPLIAYRLSGESKLIPKNG